MKIRLGVCSDCGAQYKIPVSFSANRAKCKQCGGVTEIGPPVAEPDAGAPAKKVEAKAAAKAAAPAKPPVQAPKKNPPPMPAKKVRPAAEKPAPKKAAAKKAAPKAPAKAAPKPAAKPKAQPVAKKAQAPAKPVAKAASKPAPKPKAAAPKAVQKKGDDALVEVRGSGKKKGGMSMKERLLAERAAAAKTAPAPAQKKPVAKTAARAAAGATAARAGARAAAPAAKKAGASRSGARAGQRRGGRNTSQDEDEEIAGASRRSGGRRGRPQQSKTPMLVGLGLMAAAGIGGFLFVQNESKKTVEAGETTTEVAATNEVDAANEAAANLTDEATGGGMVDKTDEAVTPADAAPETPADEVAAADAAPEGEPEKPAMQKPKPAKDPASIDLTVYDFERAEGTTDEEWADILADVETATDLDAGAAGTRALSRLREAGRKAFPAVLNAMHDLDYTTQDGIDNGDVLQKCLREVLAGLSFNWFYTTEPDDVWKNKKAVQRWSNEWSKVADDPSYWDKISAKATRKASERESEPDPLDAELDAELDELDDLEDL